MFSPEFRNRLDAVVSFSSLSPEVMSRVVDKFIMELEAQLSDRDVTIELTDAAREWLAKKGYDKHFGARPLARIIQEHIKKPLSEELLFGALVKGGTVKVSAEDGKVAFEYEKAVAAPKVKKKPASPAAKDGGDDDGDSDSGKDETPTELVE